MRLPTLVAGLGAESAEEFVFIGIYCCWERRGGLCRGLEVLCCSSPPILSVLDEALGSVGLPGWGRAVGAARVAGDGDTSACGREGDPPLGRGDPPLGQGAGPRPGLC